jgi:hypothetical protein
MTPDRRYTDDEVAEILDRATETHTGSSLGAPSATGMTLAELQDIGGEVGIPKDAIARAAASLDRPLPDAAAHRTFLGTTVGVGRSVELPRPLTADEWNRLVVDLRMTFDAKGKIRQEGAFRQWTNGNLQALLEPTATGERLRLRTVKGSAMPGMGVGGAMMAGAAIGGVIAFFTGTAAAAVDLSMLAATGAVLFGFARIPLPNWARRREQQMEDVIERLRAGVEVEDEREG